jgi:hypothetical protein
MRIQKVENKLRIDNSLSNQEIIDIFEAIEYHGGEFIIGSNGLPCLKYDKACYNFKDSYFDLLIDCQSVILDKIESRGV